MSTKPETGIEFLSRKAQEAWDEHVYNIQIFRTAKIVYDAACIAKDASEKRMLDAMCAAYPLIRP